MKCLGQFTKSKTLFKKLRSFTVSYRTLPDLNKLLEEATPGLLILNSFLQQSVKVNGNVEVGRRGPFSITSQSLQQLNVSSKLLKCLGSVSEGKEENVRAFKTLSPLSCGGKVPSTRQQLERVEKQSRVNHCPPGVGWGGPPFPAGAHGPSSCGPSSCVLGPRS